MPGEVVGVNPNKKWKWKTPKLAWTYGDTVNASIGQGFTSVTPMQLLVMISRIVTGKAIKPLLLKNQNCNSFASLTFKEATFAINSVVSVQYVFNSPKGTGFPARIKDKQFAMAGKTGTAQVISKNISSDFLKSSLRSHSIFTGYAPVNIPKYACVVLAENAGWGSVTAGPIGREISLFAQKHNV